MLTDGFYNGSFTDPSSFFTDDDTEEALPDGTAYNPGTTNQYIYPNDNSEFIASRYYVALLGFRFGANTHR